MSDDKRTHPDENPEPITETLETQPTEPETEAEPPVESVIDELQGQVIALNELVEALRDENMRLRADMQNMRRRQQQEMERFRRIATEDLVVKLVPVLDNFERALAAVEAEASLDAILEGVRAVDRQFRGVLEGVHLRRIAAEGEDFDPERHEAIATETTESEEDGKVLAVLEPGYELAGAVVRPARVKVSRRP